VNGEAAQGQTKREAKSAWTGKTVFGVERWGWANELGPGTPALAQKWRTGAELYPESFRTCVG